MNIKTFIKKYLELAALYQKNKKHNDLIYKKIENISNLLLKKIGLDAEYISDLSNDNILYTNKKITKKKVAKFYNQIVKENDLLIKLKKLESKLNNG